VLAIVVAAQFMFGVDAFIVNVAIPTIAAELHASAAQIEAVIAVYLIVYATLVVTGGRLGDIHGTKPVFLAGVLGFTLTSLWCGLARSGPELILARLAQGATAALMVPQVLATLHLLFSDSARGRAFGIYGIVLGLAGAAGFLLGGVLVTLNLAGLGWRAVFFVNVPFGLIIMAAAWRIMPTVPRRAGTRLDVAGAIVLFTGLLCLIGPLLFGHDLHWSPWVWLVMALGVAIVAAFLRLERAVARRGGMPLIDLALLSDAAFMHGLCAAFCFFFANLSFYLVTTMFMQKALQIPPLQAGLVFVPLALAFVIASRQRRAGAPSRHARVDRRLHGPDRRSGGAAADGRRGRDALRAAAGVGAHDFRLWPRAGDGAAIRRRAFHRAAAQRRLGRGDVRHDGSDRQRCRGRGDRRGIFLDRSRRVGAASVVGRDGAVRVVDCRLRGVSWLDATRGELRQLRLFPYIPGD
jgi:MFS family permease